MTAKPEPARLQLPQGLTPEEEARWWDEHPEYWEVVGTELEWIGPQAVRHATPVTLVLPDDLITALKAQADGHAVPYQTLIRQWLQERLDTEAG